MILRRLLIIAYYGVIYSPIILGIPRYDFFGLLTATLYAWGWIIHIITRDYACVYWPTDYGVNAPEYITWLLLGLMLLYYLIKFSV